MLGTVLPTAAQLARMDAHSDRMAALAEIKALRNHPELKKCERRVVGRMFPEVRYYDTTDQYAVITHNGGLVWIAENSCERRRID